MTYGEQDASFLAAGGEAGLRKLCEVFYREMDTLPEAQGIRAMHNDDLSTMIDKLTLFLCAWLGGPKTYFQKYGFKNMPGAHQHLSIQEKERDAWLLCMDRAVDQQPFAQDFKEYLKEQLRFPAERIRQVCNM
jgi:hemoglobin